MNSKQRAILRSLASQMDAIFQIGKGNVNDAMCRSLADALEARELVKISVLETASTGVRELAEEIAMATESEVVAVIGRKIILYKMSSKPANQKITEQIR